MAASGLNFNALRSRHDSVNTLLHSPAIKTTAAHQVKLVDEISEASLKMVETCGNARDVLLLVKDHLHCLQSTFRRVSVEAAGNGNQISGYGEERKSLKKAMLQRLNSLKLMKNTKCDHGDLMAVMNVLREVRIATIAILESLMSLMSMPAPGRGEVKIKMKPNKWFFESRLTRVNSLSYWENCDTTTLQIATRRLAAVEVDLEDLEEELDCIFRRLIQTRVSLLNILTNN